MAVQPPPAPVYTPPPPPQAAKRSGCGCGCAGCLLIFVLVAVLLVGGGYFFLVAQAQAGVSSPASLVVITQPVDVGRNDSGYSPGTSGQQLSSGSSVRTGTGGHAEIQFPDGSIVRISPETTVTVTSAELTRDGNLKSASIQQKVGRTLTTVQHLVGGSVFTVGGHSITTQVRGTKFEVLVRKDGSNVVKVYEGTVTVTGANGTTVTVNAGQQVEADANGNLSKPHSIASEPQDPYAVQVQCDKSAATGTNPGTTQSRSGDGLGTGQTATESYDSPGGNMTVAFCYPGSLMGITVTDPNGVQHPAQGAAPLVVKIANGPPGHYTALVRGINVPAGGEPYSITFATDETCVPGTVDTGGVVRETLSNGQIAQSLQQAGLGQVTLQVLGPSATSARVYFYSDIGKVPITWTIDFYAATPNLGVVLTEVTVRNVNVTAQVVSKLAPIQGQALAVIPTDFTVDRVYSCTGAAGTMMVVEGHRQA
jgi:hypothetical protein